MNLASALIKQILELQDFETWGSVRKHYLPAEYHTLYTHIEKHSEQFHKLPTLEDLKLGIRDSTTREKVYAIESLQVEADAYILLEYLKNEYTQKEILSSLDGYIDNSVAFESAEESLEHLHQIVLDVEDKVELEPPQESMQRIPLFEDDEDLERYLPLGFNSEYDNDIRFSPIDLILVGGPRGSGKSVTCANLANNVYSAGRSAIYFTIEMDSRSTLQRICAIATNIPFSRLKIKNLSVLEWEKVATWWAERFIEGSVALDAYKDHRDFDKFHSELTTNHMLNPVKQLDIVYDPSLTISKIRTEIDKKIKSDMDLGVIIVDYINQVKRSSGPGHNKGQYDWTEQIEVSKALKSMAQEYQVPVFSPYQTDAGGEARFAKGILDAADAAFTLKTYDHEDACVTFDCVKMRNASMRSFTSEMDWETLTLGPETSLTPKERESSEGGTGEAIDDVEIPF